jgi:hypothetical protein
MAIYDLKIFLRLRLLFTHINYYYYYYYYYYYSYYYYYYYYFFLGGGGFLPKFEDENLYKMFLAGMDFCKIGP